MNLKNTSFSYTLITLALWSSYSFGAASDDVIAGSTPTYGGNNGNNIIAGDGPSLSENAHNNIMNTTGKPHFGGSYSLVIGESAGNASASNAKYI